ncbi:hypothetical protein AC579_2405 [Pseudocercospora musae]|uniref:Uncharacterized protein n=1 Tax=Pseudocercospora musae TaxID=113226 RepID=A0A139I9R7_9PEZI|nr:hypothetical protein AC579_2405 [Pseudocercospora musae]
MRSRQLSRSVFQCLKELAKAPVGGSCFFRDFYLTPMSSADQSLLSRWSMRSTQTFKPLQVSVSTTTSTEAQIVAVYISGTVGSCRQISTHCERTKYILVSRQYHIPIAAASQSGVDPCPSSIAFWVAEEHPNNASTARVLSSDSTRSFTSL